MAWRIHDNVLKGEIDNRERGQVRGRVWLLGRDEPLMLNLSGNCRRDLAGCLFSFVNPRSISTANLPSSMLPSDMAVEQTGVAGEITASRKVRVFDVPIEETLRITSEGGTPPEHMANSLYI